MEKIKSKDGTPIAYIKQGDGPPLVLVYGNGMIAKNWMRVLPGLAKHFTVYVMERRGRGESGDTEPYAIEREYEDIAALVDSIDQPVNLLGHSFGGVLSLEAALLTNNVRKLLLYEPPLNLPDLQIVPGGLIDPMENLIFEGQKEEALLQFYESIGVVPAEIEMMQTLPEWMERVEFTHTIAREIKETERHSFNRVKFSGFPIPTKFLVSGDDLQFWHDVLQSLNQTLHDFSTETLPGQGHFLMDSAPDLFVDVVTRFFKG